MTTACTHQGEQCEELITCDAPDCTATLFNGYVFFGWQYCEAHKPETFDITVMEMREDDEFEGQEDVYYTEWELCDHCETCPEDCACHKERGALLRKARNWTAPSMSKSPRAWLLTDKAMTLIIEALGDAQRFYELFDDMEDRADIIEAGQEATAQAMRWIERED